MIAIVIIVIFIMCSPAIGFVKGFESGIKENTNKKRNINRFNLTKKEQKLVKQGKYNPWDFDDDDLDEDSYYFEDDK